MESEKSGFVNEMSEIWRKMQVKKISTKLRWKPKKRKKPLNSEKKPYN